MTKAQIIAKKDAEILRLRAENQTIKSENQAARFKIEILEDEVSHLKRIVYGQKRERFVATDNPDQLILALGLDQEEEPQPAPPAKKQQIAARRKQAARRKKKPTGRQPWPAELKRVEEHLQPEGDLTGMKQIGERRTEILEYTPAQVYVRVVVRPIYAGKADPKTGKTRVVAAELPSRPLPKSSVGTGLLAMLVCDKFLDHLPLYRQMKRYERLDVNIAKSTLNGWLKAVCEVLRPLGEALDQEVMKAAYLQADETRLQVLDKTHNQPRKTKIKPFGKTHRDYLWPYFSPQRKLVSFHYCKGRGKQYPKLALENFKGYLQTDGYAAYEQFEKHPDITLVGCLAHVRRKFFDARANAPNKAQEALTFIRKLYDIEAQAREESFDHQRRHLLRQEKAKPLWDKFVQWLDEQQKDSLPQSSFGKAITYAINRKKYCARYLLDGKIEIDNNLVENKIRPVALGRKNYLFAGSEKGAENIALLYSLMASCQLNDIDPYTWLKDILDRIAEQPINQIHQLLPHNWEQHPPQS